jgi:hypothetical protein
MKRSGSKSSQGKKNKFLYWLPRILSLLLIAFFLLFSLDVFSEESLWWEMIFGFFMHNIPTLVLGGLTWLAWKKEKIGGIVFILLAIAFTIFFKTYTNIFSILTITGVPLLIGILYLLNHYKKIF